MLIASIIPPKIIFTTKNETKIFRNDFNNLILKAVNVIMVINMIFISRLIKPDIFSMYINSENKPPINDAVIILEVLLLYPVINAQAFSRK